MENVLLEAFLTFLDTELKKFGFSSFLLKRCCENHYVRVHKIFFRTEVFLKKFKIFLIILGHWSKFFPSFWQTFFSGVVKYAFYVSLGNLWGEEVSGKTNFSTNVGFWTEFFRLCVDLFSLGLSKLQYSEFKNIFRTDFVLKNSLNYS